MKEFLNFNELEFEEYIDSKPQLKKIIGLSKRPFALAIQLSKVGFTSLKRNLIYILLTLFVNILIIGNSLNIIMESEWTWRKMLYFLLIIIVGIVGIVIISFRSYKMVILDFYVYLFQEFNPFVKKVADYVIEKIDGQVEDKVDYKRVQTSLETYVSKVPWIIRKPAYFLLRITPITKFLTEIYESDTDFNSPEAKSQFLFDKINDYVNEFVNDQRSTKWILLIIGICLVIQLYFLLFKLM